VINIVKPPGSAVGVTVGEKHGGSARGFAPGDRRKSLDVTQSDLDVDLACGIR